MTATHLQQKIRHYLDEQGLSVMALEREAGLKGNVVRNILRGQSKSPTSITLSSLAKRMGCTISDLLGEEAPFSLSGLKNKEASTPSPLFENVNLLATLLQHIEQANKKSSYRLTMKEAFRILEDLYTYTRKKPPESVDVSLVEWFIERTIRIV